MLGMERDESMKILERLSEIEKNVLNEVRHKNFSRTSKSFPPSPIVGSEYEVSTIKLLNENVLNMVLQFNEVKDNWHQNYATLTAIMNDVDQIVSGAWQGHATRLPSSVQYTIADAQGTFKEVASGIATAADAGDLGTEIDGLTSVVSTGAAVQAIMDDVGVRLAAAFKNKTDPAVKDIVDGVGSRLASALSKASDSIVTAVMNNIGSKETNSGVENAAITGVIARLNADVAGVTGGLKAIMNDVGIKLTDKNDTDSKAVIDDTVKRLAFAITADVDSRVKAIMGDVGVRLASAVTENIDSRVKATVGEVGVRLVAVVTEKMDSAVKAAMDVVDEGSASAVSEFINSAVTTAMNRVTARLTSAVTKATDSAVKAILNGVRTRINAAVTEASDFAVKAALGGLTAGLARAIDSAVATTLSGGRLASNLIHDIESAVQVVMDGVSTRIVSEITTSMDSIGAKLVSIVTEITDSATRAIIDRVGDHLVKILSDNKLKEDPTAAAMKRDPADLGRLLFILDQISSISKPFNNDPDAVWIASSLHKLVLDVLFSSSVLLTNLRSSDRKEKFAQVSGALKTLSSMEDSSVTSKVIIEVASILSEVMTDHTKDVAAAGALIIFGAVKSIMTMKVDEDLIKGLTRGAVAAFEVFLHMKASERLELLIQVSPQRAPTEPLLPLHKLKMASATMAKATGNWLITCQYLNTLSKVSFVAFQNLLSDKSGIHQECLQLLQASIVGSKGVIGILPLLKKHSQKNQPSKTDFLRNTICNAESLSGMLQSAASEALGELMESIEKISEDKFNSSMQSAEHFLLNVKKIDECNQMLRHYSANREAINATYPKMFQKLAILKRLKLMLNGLLDVEEWMYLFERSISKVQGHLAGLKGAINVVLQFFNLFRNVPKYKSKQWMDTTKQRVAQVEQIRFDNYNAHHYSKYAESDQEGKFKYHYYVDNYSKKQTRYSTRPPDMTRGQWDIHFDGKTFDNIWGKLDEIKLANFERITFMMMSIEYRNLIPTNFIQPKFEDIWNQFEHLGGGELETVINDFEKLFFMTQRCGEAIDNSITTIKDIKSALFKDKEYSINNKAGEGQKRKYILKFWDSLPEDVDTLRRFIDINDREEDRDPAVAKEKASDWIFRESTSRNLEWLLPKKDLDMIKATNNACTAIKCLAAQFGGNSAGNVTGKIQQTSSTIQYISQLLNKLEDLFADVSNMNVGDLGQLVTSAMEKAPCSKEELVSAIKVNIMRNVANGMKELKTLTELKGFDGWWQPLSQVWDVCMDNMGAMSTLRDSLPKLLGPGSNPRLVEEAAVSTLLNLLRIAKELSLVEPGKLGWSSEVCSELSDLLNLMTVSVSKVQANSPNPKVQNLFQQDVNRAIMKHAIEKSWLRIEEETIKSRNESVENFQEFEKVCQDGEKQWTSAGKVGFVDATHEMLKANDIQNAVDATKNVASQLQHCQAGLSGLSPIILSKMTRHTKEITRIRKMVLDVVVSARVTVAPLAKPYRCVGCSYVSSRMDQKTLKLDNLIEKMDRLKVQWVPKTVDEGGVGVGGGGGGEDEVHAKGGSKIADVRNLKRPASAAPSLKRPVL